MASAYVYIFGAIVAIIMAVLYFTNSASVKGCPTPGHLPCTDVWTGTTADNPPYRLCSSDFQYVTDGSPGGPQQCQVSCAPGPNGEKLWPCWDDNAKTGSCLPGSTAKLACAGVCSASGANACQNGGVCKTGVCECPKGYSGTRCEVKPSLNCNNTPGYCGANGTCNALTGLCDCARGWYGPKCDSQGVCDLSVCQKVDKGAVCVDPSLPNNGDCLCSGTGYPKSGPNACSTCAPNTGPVGNCSLSLHGTGVDNAPTIFSLVGGNGDHCWDSSLAWNNAAQHNEECRAQFGPNASFAPMPGYDDQDYCRHDPSCPSDWNRYKCIVPQYYTNPGVDLSDPKYAVCNTNGPIDREDMHPTTLYYPGFLPI